MALSKLKSQIFKTKYFGFVIGLALFLIFLYATIFRVPIVNLFEQYFLDFNFRLKTGSITTEQIVGAPQTNLNLKVSDDIILIGIDNEALDKLGKWPFPRAYEATLLNAITRISRPENRERAVFLDMNFIEKDEKTPENDVLLIESIKANGRVYLESFFQETDFQQSLLKDHIERQKVLFNKSKQVSYDQIIGDYRNMYLWRSVEAPLKPYGEATHGYGDVSSKPDEDKIFRRQFMLTRFPEMLDEYRYENLESIPPPDSSKFERIAWMDKNGVYHDIEFPLTKEYLGKLKTRMEEESAWKEVEIEGTEGESEKFMVVYRFKDYIVPSVTLKLALEYLNVKLSDLQIILGDHIVIPNPQKFNTETQQWEKYLDSPAMYSFPVSIPKQEFENDILNNALLDDYTRDFLLGNFAKNENSYDLNPENKNNPEMMNYIAQVFMAIKYDKVKLDSPEKYLDEIRIPIDERCRMIINFMGPQSSTAYGANQTYITRPFYGYYAKAPGPDPDSWPSTKGFANKLLIVGMFAKGLADEKPTPFGLMFGPEIIANSVNTIIMNNFLNSAPVWLNILLLFGLVFLVTLISSRFPIIWSMILSLGIIVVYFFVNIVVFDLSNLILNFTVPVLAIVLNFISIVVFRVMTEEREKRKIKNMFGKYVSPTVVEKILEHPPELGGVDKELTVLFSDIRGFTTLSERMTPQALVNHLNEYLTAMTNTILEYKGTLDKYVGDEIMCFWGAPLPQADHAILACKCAIKQMEVLHQLNRDWPTEKRLDIGIGLNSGIMTVGNMGSMGRMNYTLTGDNVNLGARLEGTNKQYTTNIIISEFTYGLVKNKVVVRELDNIRVKGKNKPVLIYELIDIEDGV